MSIDTTIIALSKQEIIRLEMIVIDSDKDEALAFMRELRSKIESHTIRGLKSHLDK
jgi:lactam utilization protein B